MIIESPTKKQRSALRALWKESFGDGDSFISTFRDTAFSPERCRVATVGKEVIAALYWFDCVHMGRPVAYLYAVATAKEHRGKGVCSALMVDTHTYLRESGYAGTILVPGAPSLFAFYERMGYKTCSRISETRCDAAEVGLPLREIGAAAYARLRKRFLPVGGVVQERESLRFLQAQADFYAGSGFVLAAKRKGDTLYGIELLGDRSAAPAVVKALGCQKGILRHPGDTEAFAMHLPLTEDAVAPSYFGLAFD